MRYDITFHPSWWHKNAGVDFTQEFFDDPRYRIECDVRMRKTLYEHFGDYGIGEKEPKRRPLLGTDLLAAGYLHSEILGCRIRFQADNSPQVECLNLDEDAIGEVKVPNLDESPVWAGIQKQMDYLKERFGYVETYVNLMGIQNIAMDLMGQEVLLSYYTAPEEVETLLEKITELSLEVGKRFYRLSGDISGGVTAIVRRTVPDVYLTSNCSVEMVSNDIYEKFLLKHDRRLADAFGHFGIHHCGKSMEHVVDGYSRIKNLAFAEVGAFSDIKAVRGKLPGVFLNARYSPVRLMSASETQITEEVQALVRDGQENGRKVSVSCVGIDSQVPDTQIRYFLRACREIKGIE